MTSDPSNPPPPLTPRKLALYSLFIVTFSIASAFAIRAFGPKGSLASAITPALVSLALVIPAVLFMRRVIGRKPSKENRVAVTILSTVAGISFLVATGIANPKLFAAVLSNPSGALMPLTFFFVFPGLQLLIFALRHRRVGDSLHCPKCDYELGVSPDDAPIRCPECGTAWLGRWQKGASRRSPTLALVGALLMLSGALPWLFKLTALGNVSLGLLPTPTLISVTALDAWGHNKDAWAELSARKLTPQDSDLLATKLLNLRVSAGYLYGPPASWLDTAVTTQSISQPLIDRYYADWFEPQIGLPDTILQNEPTLIVFNAEDRKGGPATWLYIWIESVSVDGVPLVDANFESTRQKWFFSLEFTDPAFPTRAISPNNGPNFPYLDTSQPGPHTIAVTLYRCVVPRATVPAAPPTSQSNPTRPPNALHFEKQVVEKKITITPP